jgi:hypothetical protein
MNYHGLVKRLDLPAGWIPPRQLSVPGIDIAAVYPTSGAARWDGGVESSAGLSARTSSSMTITS